MARNKVYIKPPTYTKAEKKKMSSHAWAQFGHGTMAATSNIGSQRSMERMRKSTGSPGLEGLVFTAHKSNEYHSQRMASQHKKAYEEIRLQGYARGAKNTLGGSAAPKHLKVRHSWTGRPLATWSGQKANIKVSKKKAGLVKIKKRGSKPYYFRVVNGKRIRVKKGKRK